MSVATIAKRLSAVGSLQLARACMLLMFAVTAGARDMPDELYHGMIQYELDSGRYFDALVVMDNTYKKTHLVNYIAALQGFNLDKELPGLIEQAKNSKNLSDADYFKLGKAEYLNDECLSALKLFKKIQNNLPLESKEPMAFYRANCFIKLGSSVRAAQSLTGMIGGLWSAYAYYNLAISYAEESRDKTKALVALRVAESLNAGRTKEAKSLNDRINLVAGKLYLDSDKKDSAIQFFKKVYLDSESTPAALYLIGLAQLESGDFRAATQAWHSLKSYPLVDQSVAEAALAIPFAFERSGYLSQTIEAYLEASNSFETELEKINKIDELLSKHGAVKIFIDDSEIEGLEWFLAKDVVKNTTRAAYYQYLMKDPQFYDQVELYEELTFLHTSLEFWLTQLAVFERSLQDKKSTFKVKQSRFDANGIKRQIDEQNAQISSLTQQAGMTDTLAANLQVEDMRDSIQVLRARLSGLQQKIQQGEKRLNDQSKELSLLVKDVGIIQKRLNQLMQKLSAELTTAAKTRLKSLRKTMVSNFERAEQGLIHIFEDMAESKQVKKRNLLDGRYQ